MEENKSLNFIEEIISNDLKEGKYTSILTRFPPEPNGYLHMGHAASICLNFGVAQNFGGNTNLRFDDTNPVTEDTEYVESIQQDVKWLGFDWANIYYASDYFDTLYNFAVQLIQQGDAYVCDLSAENIAQQKGTPTEAGTNSPYRNRSVDENLNLFARMKAGEFKEGDKNKPMIFLGMPSEVKGLKSKGILTPYGGKETKRVLNWYNLTEKGKLFF